MKPANQHEVQGGKSRGGKPEDKEMMNYRRPRMFRGRFD
jgi:hypothetical protein